MEDFVRIHTLANRFEEDVLVSALESEGIEALVKTFQDTAYDGIFVTQKGWGHLLVPPEAEERGRAIIEPILADLATRGIYQDPVEIDPTLWERLAEADPDDLCARALVAYDPRERAYLVPVFGTTLRVFPAERHMEPADSPAPFGLDFDLYLVVLHYLLNARSASLTGTWAGEKELPGGAFFFRGPHALTLDPVTDAFGTRPEDFAPAAQRLGGAPETFGDAAARLPALPRVPVLVILWRTDDEFPASARIRFDSSVTRHLPQLDTIFALARLTARALAA